MTTQQTIVDPADDDRAAYPGRPPARQPQRDPRPRPEPSRGRETGGRDDAPEPGRWNGAPAREPSRYDEEERWSGGSRPEPWSDPRLREYLPPAPAGYDDSGEIAPVRRGRPDDDPADDPRWSGMRSGDRWAEVRDDDRGRELRMGERRTAVRADETGTHLRIVDRWATVREEHDGYTPAGFRDGAENTGETRRQRRDREEAEAAAGAGESRRASRRSSDDDRDEYGTGRRALTSSGHESASAWIRGTGDHETERREPARDRTDDRSRSSVSRPYVAEIQGETSVVPASPRADGAGTPKTTRTAAGMAPAVPPIAAPLIGTTRTDGTLVPVRAGPRTRASPPGPSPRAEPTPRAASPAPAWLERGRWLGKRTRRARRRTWRPGQRARPGRQPSPR